ncbi:MAG TPA: DUF484 family protein [Rhizomicrobium sp.]|jgi:hypothetical protein|nr:DUF484 family protein [Rhizomicrobium sp.]
MTESAPSRAPAKAAAEAVKAYIRMHRAQLSRDGEILALLLPERFASGEVRDLQRYVIDRLATENVALRTERDALRNRRARAVHLGDGVRRMVLDLVDARSFEEVIAIAKSSGARFSAERAALCVEGEESSRPKGSTGVRLIASGMVDALLGEEGAAAVLSNGGGVLLGHGGGECRSIAAFRLKIGDPAAIYVIGAREEHRFDSEELITDLTYFARALERAIRAWLDLPKL